MWGHLMWALLLLKTMFFDVGIAVLKPMFFDSRSNW